MIPLKNGYGLNLQYDRELALSTAQVLDNTADTANDEGAIHLASDDFPKGKPIKGVVDITALVGTLTIKVCGSNDGSDPVATDLIETHVVDAGETGLCSFTIPQTAEVDRVMLFYSAGTSGTVSAWLTTEV